MRRGEFLLEVGCEEIPAWMLPRAMQSLQSLLEQEFAARGLSQVTSIEVLATPRRLAALGRNLAPREQDRVEEIIGPPKSVALDASGKPTQAGEGFARKQGLRWQDLKEVATPKGTYMAAVRRTKGRAMDVVLRELVPRVIRKFEFPRTMYWTSPEGLRFVRPIRWLVVLWNGKAVKMELDGVRSGGASWGHRLLANSQVPLRGVDSYQPRLKKASVLVAPAARQRKIEREMAGALRRKGLRLKPDAELLRLVVNLTEYPSVVLGSFDARFLSLPKEVLVTVMRHHQRYFSVADKRGRLAPKFIAVIDQEHDRDGGICRGHESVLEARFRDAEFFWQADQKLTLEARRSLLAYVTFVSGAGNYGQKVARLQKLVLWLAQHLGEEGSSTDKQATQCRRADMKATMRAASLCKSDLTTEMVRELPELQGVCGGLYARAQKENPLVADAIYEHYRPRGPAEPIPASAEGAVLALADKLDSLAACFSVRLLPTGSQDPFALRRAGTGVVRLLVEGNLAVPLAAALQHSLALVREQGIGVKGQDPTPELRSFLGDRASHYFREQQRYAYDEVSAVLEAGWDDLSDASLRLRAVHHIRTTPDFEPVAASFKRIRNILEQAGGMEQYLAQRPNQALLETGPERQLHQQLQRLALQVDELRQRKAYQAALRSIASLRPVVDLFFDKVLVMAPDKRVRANRLCLLAHLLKEFSTVADFSKLVPHSKD